MQLKHHARIQNHWNYLNSIKSQIDNNEKITLTKTAKEAKVSGACNAVALKLGIFKRKLDSNGTIMRNRFEWNEKIPITLTLAETLINEVREHRELRDKMRAEKKKNKIKTEKMNDTMKEKEELPFPKMTIEDVFNYSNIKVDEHEDMIKNITSDPALMKVFDMYLKKGLEIMNATKQESQDKEPYILEEVKVLWGLYSKVKKQIK